ncbi:MAG: hypothetical protein LBS03_10230 [Bacteroidales bacterium]|jgi:hypothetical protein|nr:hypothetical protein [Bacteroidales bacterium]
MEQDLYFPADVAAMIRKGERLLLAGDIRLLSQLPEGEWIAGTTNMFLLPSGAGTTSYDRIFACPLPDFVTGVAIREYDRNSIRHIFNEAPANGFTVLILPFGSEPHLTYAVNAGSYENFATRPICGWVSGGASLATVMTDKCYAVSGMNRQAYSDMAVAMHIAFPCNKYAELHIFNPYRQGSEKINFISDGIVVKKVLVNGVQCDFAGYLRDTGFDLTLPFVADYSGALINVVVSGINGDEVYMTTPVFRSLDYYTGEINPQMNDAAVINDTVIFSVYCISNYLKQKISEIHPKRMSGPMVFGEIAYQLLNKTTVYATVGDTIPASKA